MVIVLQTNCAAKIMRIVFIALIQS